MTNLTFTIDGNPAGTFVTNPGPGAGYNYNILGFSTDSLANASHEILISTTGDASLILFDYLTYRYVVKLRSISSCISLRPHPLVSTNSLRSLRALRRLRPLHQVHPNKLHRRLQQPCRVHHHPQDRPQSPQRASQRVHLRRKKRMFYGMLYFTLRKNDTLPPKVQFREYNVDFA